MHINVTNKKNPDQKCNTSNGTNLADEAPPQRSGSTLTTIQVLNRPQLQSVKIQGPNGTQEGVAQSPCQLKL